MDKIKDWVKNKFDLTEGKEYDELEVKYNELQEDMIKLIELSDKKEKEVKTQENKNIHDKQSIKNIIKEVSKKFDLDWKLVYAIAQQESNLQTECVRYEQGFYNRYIKGKNVKTFGWCSKNTEEIMRSTSFGIMQIMGQVAREVGCKENWLTRLLDPNICVFWACKKIQTLFNRKNYGIEDVIAAYNQGNKRFIDLDNDGIKDENEKYHNQSYVDKVLENYGGLENE